MRRIKESLREFIKERDWSKEMERRIAEMFNAAIISQKIALKELRDSSRATGMWNNITDEDIEKADGEFGIGGEVPDIMGSVGVTPQPEKLSKENMLPMT
jgi:hypothetical protein